MISGAGAQAEDEFSGVIDPDKLRLWVRGAASALALSVLAALAWSTGIAPALTQSASPPAPDLTSPFNAAVDQFCGDHKCAFTVFGGQRLETGEGELFGISGYSWSPKNFVPPWQYQFGDSYILGGTLSRQLVGNGYGDIEAEVGVGQRFGQLHEQEGWVAVYFRWKSFPWNNIIRTSVAVSTGLNYADGIPPYEIAVSNVGHGSRLLHYLSPEITFGLPSDPYDDFIIRLHHRSGAGQYFGYIPLFKGVWGGTQELVFGYRHYF